MNTYVVNNSASIQSMFQHRGHEIVQDMKLADVVVFPGGGDVHPRHYGQDVHPRTYPSEYSDEYQIEEYKQAASLGKPMIGICRGAQLMCAMTGGSLYQDINNHGSFKDHDVIDLRTGQTRVVTSLHHQMMAPPDDAEIVAVASEATYREYMDSSGNVVTEDVNRGEDVEVVWFPSIQGLAFQGHPEMSANDSDCTNYFFELIEEYLGE